MFSMDAVEFDIARTALNTDLVNAGVSAVPERQPMKAASDGDGARQLAATDVTSAVSIDELGSGLKGFDGSAGGIGTDESCAIQ